MRQLLRIAAPGLMIVLQGAALATPPPPAPTDVVVSGITPLTYKRGSFVLEFKPVARHTTYQFIASPKFCSFKGTASGTGNFPTATFTTAPYRVQVEFNCKYNYTVSVATAPPDAYTTRSEWKASPVVSGPVRTEVSIAAVLAYAEAGGIA